MQIQADAPYRAQPEDIGNVYVRSTTTNEMIPVKALINVQRIVGPEQIDRYIRGEALENVVTGEY